MDSTQILEYAEQALAVLGLGSVILAVVVRLTPWQWDDLAVSALMRWLMLLAPAVASVKKLPPGTQRNMAIVQASADVLRQVSREREALHAQLERATRDVRDWVADEEKRIAGDAAQRLNGVLRADVERVLTEASQRLSRLVDEASARIEVAATLTPDDAKARHDAGRLR